MRSWRRTCPTRRKDLDRSVVAPNQIRTVLQAYREGPPDPDLPRPHGGAEDADLRQGRHHADDIVHTARGVQQGTTS